jgi:hypothetical protein
MRRIVMAMLLAANGAAVTPTLVADQSQGRRHHANAALYAIDARPFGAGMDTWAERATQWIYAQPLDRSPLFDPTGGNCDVAQSGPVWYIARIAGPPVFTGTRNCAVPHGKAILLFIGAVTNTFPCPDPSFAPAPGQSLYDFLAADAKALMDTVDHLEISLDGRPMKNVFRYRFASENLFSIKGDLTLQSALDPCITGDWQPAVIDGFFMMFKPLTRGAHTIRVHGTNTFGHDKTFIYQLQIV